MRLQKNGNLWPDKKVGYFDMNGTWAILRLCFYAGGALFAAGLAARFFVVKSKIAWGFGVLMAGWSFSCMGLALVLAYRIFEGVYPSWMTTVMMIHSILLCFLPIAFHFFCGVEVDHD